MIKHLIVVPTTAVMPGTMAGSAPLAIVGVVVPIVPMIVVVCPIVSVRPVTIPIIPIRATMVAIGSPIITIRATIVVPAAGITTTVIGWVSGIISSVGPRQSKLVGSVRQDILIIDPIHFQG